MIINPTDEYLQGLVKELCKLPHETEWVEFKGNNKNPESIGRYISALANSAALHGKPHGHVIWGVEDQSHDIVGTTFAPWAEKVGNEPLEIWLHRLLSPQIDFQFYQVKVDNHPVIVLEVGPATHQPVAFQKQRFIRIGSVQKKLQDHPEKEKSLWRLLDRVNFEDGIAVECQSIEEVLLRLDYPAYFHLLGIPLPDGRNAILEALQNEGFIKPSEAGGFDITNLGAILFARKLSDFRMLERKALRIIQYRGKSKMETIRERVMSRGYAAGFADVMDHIISILPANERVEKALRITGPMFPEISIREIVANAIIHQDFEITGAGPMVEIFDDRIEVTNPGEPLVDTQRFLDATPRSRNEDLAAMMRRARICEERGSGIDRVVLYVEMYQLPAPLFQASPSFTRVVLFSHKPLKNMNVEERVRACYFHACLKRVMSDFLTNASIRERLGLDQSNRALASRLIRSTVDAGMIKPFDENAAKKLMKYVPFWA